MNTASTWVSPYGSPISDPGIPDHLLSTMKLWQAKLIDGEQSKILDSQQLLTIAEVPMLHSDHPKL